MAFDPDKPLAPEIRVIENALIVPFGAGKTRGIARRAGVYDAEGNYIPESQCFRFSEQPTTVEPDGPPLEEPQIQFRGKWLYGGLLYQHFGHFMLESTGRLWAAEQAFRKVKGELFLLKGDVAHAKRPIKIMSDLIHLFGARGRWTRGVIEPVRVEKLVVAPQGFGTGDMIAGCPEYRAFTRRVLSEVAAPDGAERIYISRSRLFSKRGRYFGEARIEKLFEDEGYRIYHPQEEPIEAQIAQYRAAKVIVSSDSSALHLAAFFADPGDKIGIVLRRPGDIISDYLTQYRVFAGIEPNVINALSGRYYQLDEGKKTQKSELYAELDLQRLGVELAEQGYIQRPALWKPFSAAVLKAEREEIGKRLERKLVPVEI